MKLVPASWSMPAWRMANASWTARKGLLVAIERDGVTGVGEASPLPGFSRDDLATCRSALAATPPPDDADPAALAAALSAAYPPAAAWAVFTAILDARARARGVPLAALLAPRPATRVPVAAVVDGIANALLSVAAGVRTLKLKIGGSLGDLDDSVAAIAQIRDAVGPTIALRADGNRSFPAAALPTLLDRLAPLDVEYVEEPSRELPLAVRTVPPLALDESLASPDVDPAIDAGRVAAVVLKPTVLGPARTLQLAARARAAGVAVVLSHTLEGPVGFAACAELALAFAPAVGAVATGVHPHRGLDAWGLAIPTVTPAALEGVPRIGHGVDPAAALEAAR
jgi:o-succinylbenzoate synthase